MSNIKVNCGKIEISNKNKICLISGPCQLESEQHALDMVGKIKEITSKFNLGFIYKTSFDKANRTSLKGKRGIGLDASLPIFDKIKKDLDVPILTDVHNIDQCSVVAKHVDILQIPAFLCRQTDLLRAAAQTGKPVNVKKGQFLSPQEMGNVKEKLISFGCDQIILTERGTTFGYNNLVVDFRSIPILKTFGWPVAIDATHSVQMPGKQGDQSGGDRSFAKYMMRCGLVCGADVVFAEVHNDPDNAPSDGPNMLHLDTFENFVKEIRKWFDASTE